LVRIQPPLLKTHETRVNTNDTEDFKENVGTVSAQQLKNAEFVKVSKSVKGFGTNFFGDSTLELSKKKMPISQKSHFHAIIGYRPPRLIAGKSCWYIGFYAFDPIVGELRQKRIKLNHINPVSTRRLYANELIKRLNERLIDGWSPWIESENSNAYKLFSEVCESFKRYQSRQLETDVIRLDTFRAYKSFLKNIEAYNEKIGKIKYIYQFDQSFVSKFLDYIFVERENTARTRNNYLTFLSLFSTWLVEKQYMKHKPTDGFSSIGRRSLQKKKRTVIPADVLQNIGDYFRENDKRMLLACYVLHLCFIRPKEMSRLKIEAINFEKSTILIPAEVSKNRKNETVTVSDDLKELFFELKINKYPSNYYLFSDDCEPGANYRSSKQFNDRWDKMKKVLKLPKQYQFYSLKDTGITNLFRSGLDSLSIRDQARHYNISITDTYTPRDIQEANEKIKVNSKGF